ncbi:MAG: AgmX/PglI C-terminal domain-containing protein [Deltaproteobacteria bacterium]|jgi:hypothetical protein|nr:AgmX/PglI C-terminal domain-containing protein [Deltaproteobacteria bacterium]
MANGKGQRQGQGQGGRIRSLRIGIILGKKIIEERLFRVREGITVGQSAKNTFCVPTRGLPKSFTLFTVEDGSYCLNFTDNFDLIESRVAAEGTIKKLVEVKNSSSPVGGVYKLRLPESGRGKVVVGGLTLLFQFVNAPPLQPRPRLPASVRGSLADRIDPMLAIILFVSLLFHGGVAIWAGFFADPYVGGKIEKARREFREDMYREATISTFKVPTEPVATTEGPETTDGGGTAEKPSQKPSKGGGGGGGGSDDGGGGDDGAPDDAAFDDAINNSAMVKMLTGGEGKGSPFGKMSETDQGAGLANQINDVKKSGATVATTGGAGAKRGRGSSSGRIGTGKGPGVKGIKAGDVGKTGTKTETKIKSRASFDVDDIDMTSLDPDAVARRIRSRYLGAIKRCHEQALKRDPKIGGRIDLQFTVSIAGKVTKARIKRGFDPQVSNCVLKLTRRWRFPAPKDDDGDPTSATFVIPLVLKAG